MRARVVDASALGALAFGEPQAEAVARRLGRAPLAAPALLWFELCNLCRKKLAAHPGKASLIQTAFHDALELSIQVGAVDYPGVVDLAVETGLTAYDASYLWLAEALEGELVTLDERLESVARVRLK